MRFPCTVCDKSFNDKSHLKRYMKNIHVNVPAHLRPLPTAPINDQPARPSVIQFAPRTSPQIAPQIFVPDAPAGASNTTNEDSQTEDDICMQVMDEFEDADFLRPLMLELVNLLKISVQKHAIKFNLKFEATYNRPNVPNSSENRAFKTLAVEIFPDSDIRTIAERAYMKLMKEKDDYTGRGSGFTLESIDELLVAVYKYTLMGGSSYIELPAYIDRKRATINPQNIDHECFKWAILARHVTENLSDKYKYCVGENYKKHEDKYNFEGITYPTPLSDVAKFEKNNNNVSVNIYGLDRKIQSPKSPRQTLCSKCNLELQQPKFVPVFFHNLSNYDAHLIVTELGYDTQAINVIPNSEEKFISFSKYISSTFTAPFIDTFRFMASSLSSLAENLITPEHENFRETAKHFVAGDMPLVTRKGVYPYEYTDSWERLDEEGLPSKRNFYSTLTETGIKEEDFEHAKEVWDHFTCTTLGEYSDLYLKIDVLLLADVFENFRDVCMRAYNLDAAHYFTAPGLSFDAMLKFTGQKLQLLDDYDMLLMFENGIRGGLVQASKRYGKANNVKTPGYDETKEKSWIIYQDCNNLYGWVMSQYMPYGGFNWVEPTLNGLNDLDATSPIGRVYEVDVTYPRHLHDKHNDLPFLPQNSVPHGSKVHRVIQFNQSDWLAKYIELNTMMKKRATNAFEKDFFKLMNNAVFGKTMQSKRKEMKMELVSCERRLQKLINKSTFKHCTNYNENLNAVALENKIIKFDKPIYIGFAVLDISKTLMYDYHYNIMQKHYGDKIKLMYTDTDSLIYYIETQDFYADLSANSNLLDRMDTANMPSDHPCYVATRKKEPGLFSDEVDANIITEFCALRAKSYAFNVYTGANNVGGGEKIKAKGIRAHVTKKLTYNSYDDKRMVLEDKINTLAHVHYSIEEDDIWPELEEDGGNWNDEEKELMRELLQCIT
ncbi:hypothetical protein QTP88_004560 [Uroleucon formosanum]